ncbi:MAG: DNA polymerase III subunit alpha [Leptospiraceae bacterium]|nr:DNA polymerase III subunit alpha [Leptospiraceae bacterium]MCP5494289.1 DNA polymerase III subunit alpha [Leptospiraceae bacterium]
MNDFTHLHLHTTYSMLDGAIRIPELMKYIKEKGMTSVAMTDHGNMFGAVEFYKQAKANGIKPIIGCEFYVSSNRSEEKELEAIADGSAYHLIILAKNETGYKNLIKLASRSYTEGFYKKARIDYDLLSNHSEGLVCLTACLAGEVPRKILEGNSAAAIKLAGKLNEIFRKEDFYLEIQNHRIKEQELVAKSLYSIAKKTGIPLILTNDSHFLKKEDQAAQDILLRIGTQKKIDDVMTFGFNEEFYVKSPEEMWKLFPEIPQAFHNTLEVRDKCDFNFTFGNHLLPEFVVPEGYDSDSWLAKLVEDGIKQKYPEITKEVRDRVNFELDTIHKMNFSGYFLIVQDYINFARNNGIPVGPGRGSAAGSIVAYAVGITNIEPLRYNLLFERFLNPDRKDMPDVDTDFCVKRREEVINYIKMKYGEDKVGQIITFNSLAAKAALKDVARVLNISFTESNEITKAFPAKLGLEIREALELSSELKILSEKNETNQKLFRIAEKLEGNYRQPGRHAAGVVISPYPLESVVPLSTVAEKGKQGRSIVTQYDKDMLESVGLIKMDILGLKNLTIIDHALKLIEERHNLKLDLDRLPLDDAKTFTLLKKADTLGVFQLESSGITDLVARSQVGSFEEIVALIALYRPGPMDSGMLDDYLSRKAGKKKVTYPDQSCESILKETYGVPVYQEQVMSISRVIGGFTMGESDLLRKAMAKKKKELMVELKVKFIQGAMGKGFSEKFASELFDQLEKFGGYGFNKSHSVAYAMVTYQTAYLKANYPTEFMTALLASEDNDTSRNVKFVNNAREMGIKILNPDVIESAASFNIPSDNTIRFGLSALRGVGILAANKIIDAREKAEGFKTLEDFLMHINTQSTNKKVMEALIQAGAFDSLGYSRKILFESVDYLLSFADREKQQRVNGQQSLFGGGKAKVDVLNITKNGEEWDDDERLKREKAVAGLFLSGHPLDKFKTMLNTLSKLTVEKLDTMSSGAVIEVCGLITNPEIKYTKKNDEFVNFKLEDYTGEIDCTAFPKTYQKFKDIIKEDQAVFVKGILDKVEIGEAELRGQILINSLEILNEDNLERKMERALHIKINTTLFSDSDLINKLYSILTSYKGSSAVFFHLIYESSVNKKVIRAHPHYSIEPSKELLVKLTDMLGEDTVFWSVGEDVKAFKRS